MFTDYSLLEGWSILSRLEYTPSLIEGSVSVEPGALDLAALFAHQASGTRTDAEPTSAGAGGATRAHGTRGATTVG